MNRDTITLPRSVVEKALEDLEMTINYVQSPTRREDMRDSIEALLTALEQPQDHLEQILNMVPAGWKLVPVAPTAGMVLAGEHALKQHDFLRLDASYRAMLAAAPKPPKVKESLTVEQPQSVTDCHRLQPQGEQEPYLWYDENSGNTWTPGAVKDRGDTCGLVPLYSRPQREPLTDEEITEITFKLLNEGASMHDFARAIERAHGIGGEA